MIYFIVTTCIFNDCPIRKTQYINGITKLKNIIYKNNIKNNKIIIVENNGERETYLDELDCEVFYTINNTLPTSNKGHKELQDIFDCIQKYNINDSDFIVKMTGRYLIDENSEFINVVGQLHDNSNIHCIIKYGSYYRPVNYKMKDCITGLIGMRCDYVKKIVIPNEHDSVEWKWGEATYLINDSNIYKVDKLGINICPNSNTYFFV